ncbi:MAG: hypothetical protein KQI81_24125 [Deltaproteobacteria bacterium]|nr:hypothetical protein [Deltaproteobacteria bacterium]
MQTRLKKYYFCLLLPSMVIIAAILTARALDLIVPLRVIHGQVLARVIFILAIILSVAAPVFLRTLFAYRMRLSVSTPPDAFFRFQQRLIGAALLTPYLILVTCLVDFPRFYHAGVILSALYAGYYYYPSPRRIAFDQRIFRISHGFDNREIQSQSR